MTAQQIQPKDTRVNKPLLDEPPVVPLPRSKLLHKGILLMMIPIVVQLVTFLELFTLVQRGEVLEQKEARNSELIAQIEVLQREIGSGMGSLLAEALAGSRKKATSAIEFQTVINDACDKLDKIGCMDADLQQLVSRLRTMAAEQTIVLRSMETASLEPADISRGIQVVKKSFRKVMGQTKIMEALLENEQAKIKAARERGRLSRASIKTQVMLLLSISFFSMLGLLALFLIDMTRRISNLATNARNLPERNPTFIKISGNDEISYLNAVLQHTNDRLKSEAAIRAGMAATVSHDIRAPLLAARLSVHKLKGLSATEAPNLVDQIALIDNLINKVIAFAEDLLSLEKSEALDTKLDLSIVDARELISETVTSLSPLAENRSIELRTEIEACTVVGDRIRLGQVVSNLISNAIKFSPERGMIKIIGKIAGTRYLVRVCDRGPGVPVADQAKIFSKYFQSKSAGTTEGYGLGLAICQEVISKHGGEIGVASKPGEETTFWFALPMDEESIDEEPVDEEPVDEEPVDEEPVDESSVDEEPIDEEPVQQSAHK